MRLGYQYILCTRIDYNPSPHGYADCLSILGNKFNKMKPRRFSGTRRLECSCVWMVIYLKWSYVTTKLTILRLGFLNII